MNIEEWERGVPELVTSTSVDAFLPSSSRWESLPPLPHGVSNPALATFHGQLYIFGGLKKRRIVRHCYRYAPRRSSWEELPALPAELCYPAVVVDNRRDCVWLVGGMNARYETKTECYQYLPRLKEWRVGPSLNRHRKSAFAFACNG